MGFFSRFRVLGQGEVIEGLITRSINEARRIGGQQRERLRQTMIDFFENNQHAENFYLKDFGFTNRDTLPFVSEPLTQRVIQENSLVYDFVPERRVVNALGKASKREGLLEFYAENPQIDFGIQALEQYQNLLHNVLFRVEFDPYFGKLMVYIETAYLPHFLEHNPLYPAGYSIPVKADTNRKAGTAPEVIYLYVSDGEMYLHDEKGVRVNDVRFPEGRNPYGISTVIDVSPFPASDYWSVGAKALVDCNIVLNVLQQVWAYSFQYATFRQCWGTGISKETAEALRFGFDQLWWANDPQAKFGALESDFNVAGNAEALERWIGRQLDHYNLAMNFSERGNILAGVTLKLKKGRLLKKFKKDAIFWKIFEGRLHRVVAALGRYHGLLRNVDLERDRVIADFVEPVWSVESQEDREDWDWKVKNGLKTWRDYLRAENRDLTPEEADALLKENLGYSRGLKIDE